MKETGVSYIKNEKVWNYETFFEKLKKTLTNEHFKLLTESTKQNPLKELIAILKEYAKVGENAEGKDISIEFTYEYLVKKYSKGFIKLNFPLLNGIERLRVTYYKELIFEEDISINCLEMEPYINIIEKDNEILNNSLDVNNSI